MRDSWKSKYRATGNPWLGGQAEVFPVEAKSGSTTLLALKRLRTRTDYSIRRMQREIEVGQVVKHPHVVPVLDAGEDSDWLVMPLADGSLYNNRELATGEIAFLQMVQQVCSGVEAGHELGYIHRDIKPANILFFLACNGDPIWKVADWGLVNRPGGSSSGDPLTRTGLELGTDGYMAPELQGSAHTAMPSADIYSVGQLIGWAVTGESPRQNVPNLASEGPWKLIGMETTRQDPLRRPQEIRDLRVLIDQQLVGPPIDPIARAESIVDVLKAASSLASVEVEYATELIDLAIANPTSDETYIDLLPYVPGHALEVLVGTVPEKIASVLAGLKNKPENWGYRNFEQAGRIVSFCLDIARPAAMLGETELLEEAMHLLFEWDSSYDQWKPQPRVRKFLESLTGDEARLVALIASSYPGMIGHFGGLGTNHKADPWIRDAFK